MKQETFLDTCKVLVNLPLLFDEEYIVTKTHSSLRHFGYTILPKTLVLNHDELSRTSYTSDLCDNKMVHSVVVVSCVLIWTLINVKLY